MNTSVVVLTARNLPKLIINHLLRGFCSLYIKILHSFYILHSTLRVSCNITNSCNIFVYWTHNLLINGYYNLVSREETDLNNRVYCSNPVSLRPKKLIFSEETGFWGRRNWYFPKKPVFEAEETDIFRRNRFLRGCPSTPGEWKKVCQPCKKVGQPWNRLRKASLRVKPDYNILRNCLFGHLRE